jgi:hypothetical protein
VHSAVLADIIADASSSHYSGVILSFRSGGKSDSIVIDHPGPLCTVGRDGRDIAAFFSVALRVVTSLHLPPLL